MSKSIPLSHLYGNVKLQWLVSVTNSWPDSPKVTKSTNAKETDFVMASSANFPLFPVFMLN